jgi:hypothetical protein
MTSGNIYLKPTVYMYFIKAHENSRKVIKEL